MPLESSLAVQTNFSKNSATGSSADPTPQNSDVPAQQDSDAPAQLDSAAPPTSTSIENWQELPRTTAERNLQTLKRQQFILINNGATIQSKIRQLQSSELRKRAEIQGPLELDVELEITRNLLRQQEKLGEIDSMEINQEIAKYKGEAVGGARRAVRLHIEVIDLKFELLELESRKNFEELRRKVERKLIEEGLSSHEESEQNGAESEQGDALELKKNVLELNKCILLQKMHNEPCTQKFLELLEQVAQLKVLKTQKGARNIELGAAEQAHLDEELYLLERQVRDAKNNVVDFVEEYEEIHPDAELEKLCERILGCSIFLTSSEMEQLARSSILVEPEPVLDQKMEPDLKSKNQEIQDQEPRAEQIEEPDHMMEPENHEIQNQELQMEPMMRPEPEPQQEPEQIEHVLEEPEPTEPEHQAIHKSNQNQMDEDQEPEHVPEEPEPHVIQEAEPEPNSTPSEQIVFLREIHVLQIDDVLGLGELELMMESEPSNSSPSEHTPPKQELQMEPMMEQELEPHAEQIEHVLEEPEPMEPEPDHNIASSSNGSSSEQAPPKQEHQVELMEESDGEPEPELEPKKHEIQNQEPELIEHVPEEPEPMEPEHHRIEEPNQNRVEEDQDEEPARNAPKRGRPFGHREMVYEVHSMKMRRRSAKNHDEPVAKRRKRAEQQEV